MGLLDLFDNPQALQSLMGGDMLGPPQGQGGQPPAPGGQPPPPPPPPAQMTENPAPTFAPNSTMDANAFASPGATPLPPELMGGGGTAVPMPKPRPPSRQAQAMPKSLEPIIMDAAQREGLDADYLARIAKIESGFNPRARTGSYKGLFQLSDGEFRRNGGGDIYNPEHNASAAAAKMAQESSNFREKYGRDPTPTEHYLIHQQGEGGSDAHFQNPNAPAWQNMYSTAEGQQKGPAWAKRAIWGNIPDGMKAQFGNVNNVTSADFVKLWHEKVEGENAPTPDRTGMDSPNGVRGRLGAGVPMGVPPGAIASAVPSGGLAGSLGIGGANPGGGFGGQLAPAFAALGHGLSAVGAQHPGASGAASFAAGMGGALQGGVKQADVQQAQKRQEINDSFNQKSQQFKDWVLGEKLDNDRMRAEGYKNYMMNRGPGGPLGSNNAMVNTPYGRSIEIERQLIKMRERESKDLKLEYEVTGAKGIVSTEDYRKRKEEIETKIEKERRKLEDKWGIPHDTYLSGHDEAHAFEYEKLTPQQRLHIPHGSYIKRKAVTPEEKAAAKAKAQASGGKIPDDGYIYDVRDYYRHPPYPGWTPMSEQQQQQQQQQQQPTQREAQEGAEEAGTG